MAILNLSHPYLRSTTVLYFLISTADTVVYCFGCLQEANNCNVSLSHRMWSRTPHCCGLTCCALEGRFLAGELKGDSPSLPKSCHMSLSSWTFCFLLQQEHSRKTSQHLFCCTSQQHFLQSRTIYCKKERKNGLLVCPSMLSVMLLCLHIPYLGKFSLAENFRGHQRLPKLNTQKAFEKHVVNH